MKELCSKYLADLFEKCVDNFDDSIIDFRRFNPDIKVPTINILTINEEEKSEDTPM